MPVDERGNACERWRLRFADAFNRLLIFPLANLGEAADRLGSKVYDWAERQR